MFRLEDLRRELNVIFEDIRWDPLSLNDVVDLLVDREASFKGYAENVIEFAARLARFDPDVRFVIRGRGEAPIDVGTRVPANTAVPPTVSGSGVVIACAP